MLKSFKEFLHLINNEIPNGIIASQFTNVPIEETV